MRKWRPCRHIPFERSRLSKGTETGTEDAGVPLGMTDMETEIDDVGGEAKN